MQRHRWLNVLAGLVLLFQGVAAAWAAPCDAMDQPCCQQAGLCNLACAPALLPLPADTLGAAFSRPAFDASFAAGAPQMAYTRSPFRPPAA